MPSVRARVSDPPPIPRSKRDKHSDRRTKYERWSLAVDPPRRVLLWMSRRAMMACHVAAPT